MAIDQNQVNAAADALASRKERVTIASVRDELGGGSFTTLSPLVKAWKEQHIAEAAAAEALPEEAQRPGRRPHARSGRLPGPTRPSASS